MSIDVTVVVPVWNPGRHIQPCVDSFLQQSWPAERLELIFVDDGSTDDTPEQLDRLALEQPNVRVIHEENSGWPGKPRNVGTDAARGDYVFYVDQDDHLAPHAIERMFELGQANNADVVLGKVVSDFRGIAHMLFEVNRPRCTIRDAPLIESLTPHKMFRRKFLVDNHIRFPEGKRRLEDQLFMVQAYLAARTVSIVGDYPCYFYLSRSDRKNAGSAQIDPVGYYNNLREVLDAVVRNTEPGEFRNHLLRRFYRVEMLSRISEPGLLSYDDDFRGHLVAEVQRLAHEFPAEVPDGLPAVGRARAQLVETGTVDDLTRFATACAEVKATCSLEAMTRADATWSIALRAELVAGSPSRPLWLTVAPDNDQLVDIGGPDGVALPFRSEEVSAAGAEVILVNRDTAVEWPVPHTLRATRLTDAAGDRLIIAGEAAIDVTVMAGGTSLGRGSWDISVRVRAFGLVRRVRVGSLRTVEPSTECLGPVVTQHGHVVRAYFTEGYGNLSFDVDERRKPFTEILEGLTGSEVRPDLGHGELRVAVPMVETTAGATPYWTLLFGAGTQVVARCRLDLTSGADGNLLARFQIPALSRSRRRTRRWLAVSIDPDGRSTVIGSWAGGRRGLTVLTSTDDRTRAVAALDQARARARRLQAGRRRLRRLARRARALPRRKSPGGPTGHTRTTADG